MPHEPRSNARGLRVLVLGWEYPPSVAGGLGAACHGLTTALARSEGVASVTLAVPRVRGAGEAVDGPGIERIEIDVPPARGEEALLSPYGPVGVAAKGARAGASRALYGGDLGDALQAYAAAAVDALDARAGTFDVIHAHDWMTVPAAMQLRMRLGAPVCFHVHSTAFDRAGTARAAGPLARPDGLAARIEAAGVRAADRVVAVSDFTRGVIERGYGVRAERIDVVHNGATIDEAEATSATQASGSVAPSSDAARSGMLSSGARSAAGQDSGGQGSGEPSTEPPSAAASIAAAPLSSTPTPAPADHTVLFVGRLTRQKGAGYFVRAAARLAEQRDDVRFVVVGDGEDLPRLVEEAAERGLGSRLFFTGSVDDVTRDRLYADADLYVMTSISEPFGLTPLEALGRGAPAILPNAAGVCEVLPSAPRVDPWDTDALAERMGELLDSGDERARLVEAGRAEARELTWDRSGARLAGVLQEACAP
ncbi:MAG: glycosyltransferase family 4 protein [Planctomycetota bacterium]